ncbi:MAG: toll/interleukin-1 receptor domain-containing protein [Gemmatimonadota bacterium]|nr:toll/interleukin-1 receptor domain-containing protein [Gemmatimonadota bacterium]
MLSHNSIASEWVQRELQVALQKEFSGRHVVVLPILLESVAIPPFLTDKLYADFTSPDKAEKGFNQILRAVGLTVAADKPIPQPIIQEPRTPTRTESERRLATFEDLRIIGLDEDRTFKPDPAKALFHMYLRLSEEPPTEWEQIFEAERRFPRHSMWRKAWIEGNHIIVHCVPDELEKYHLGDLKQDVRTANTKFREYLTELAQREAQESARDQRETNQIRDLKQRLDFSD